MTRFFVLLGSLWMLVLTPGVFSQEPANPNALLEQATKRAAAQVAPSIVKIETSGGTEVIARGPRGRQVRKGTGPTTGVIVDPDGYVISSAFNFANKPSDIFVSIPGQERKVAEVVATDQTRMLTLLKVDAASLPVPKAYPRQEIQVGQWSIALGRTLDPDLSHPPSVSVGIISAMDRIWGKAIQTDAKVSPVNYGGPLVALDGRVQGILVPASPQGEGETAGVEWYDSGIGFAIPFEDVLETLPRLKEGNDLKQGILGIRPKESDLYSIEPEIGTVSPESAAARSGLKPGDVIVSIDGQTVANQAQVLHKLKPKYAGDSVTLKVRRDGKELAFDNIVMTGALAALARPFLGILPMRDDPELGVAIRFVFPDSPAAKAGLQAGDRIMKLAPANVRKLAPFAGRNQLMRLVSRIPAGTEIKLEVKRGEADKTETVTTRLDAAPDTIPATLPMPSSQGRALEKPKSLRPMRRRGNPQDDPDEENEDEEKGAKDDDADAKKAEDKKVETGLIKRSDTTLNRDYWLYVPENYDRNVAHGLIIWLHPPGKAGKDANDLLDIWTRFCLDHHFIILGPQSVNERGWIASEMEFVLGHIREVMEQYTVDRQRIVAHGMGIGGQFAYYLGFNARDLIRGVASTGAVLANKPKENILTQPLAFFIVAGDKDPIVNDIREGKEKLEQEKFPVIYRQIKEFGKEYLDVSTFEELCRWIDALDRI